MQHLWENKQHHLWEQVQMLGPVWWIWCLTCLRWNLIFVNVVNSSHLTYFIIVEVCCSVCLFNLWEGKLWLRNSCPRRCCCFLLFLLTLKRAADIWEIFSRRTTALSQEKTGLVFFRECIWWVLYDDECGGKKTTAVIIVYCSVWLMVLNKFCNCGTKFCC